MATPTQDQALAALAALAVRRQNRPKQIDNASLPVGSPMYYYCGLCGHLADTMPENWWKEPPASLCVACQALEDLGLLAT